MVINIDKMLDTRKHFLIAGKEIEVVFNDKTSKMISNVYLEITDLIKKSTDIENAKDIDNKDLNEQKKIVENIFEQIRAICIDLFDSIIGDGEGIRIYNYYDGSTQALTVIIGIIEEHNQVYKEQSYKKAKNKYKKKR